MASGPTWEAVKFLNLRGEDAALRAEVCTNVVCPCYALAMAMVWLRPWVIEIDLRCYMYDQSEM